MKTLLIITDTTPKQTNGVVRTLSKTIEILSKEFDIHIISPDKFRSLPLPFYKEIDVAFNIHKINQMISDINPDFIHIATEGPVGLAGKLYCDMKGYNYTTSYHSMFPEFIRNMFGVSEVFTYPYFKWFHSNSKNVLVPTEMVKTLLESKGFKNIVIWKRGVDRDTFNSTYRTNTKWKYILCVSRVSKEKGLDDFCKMPVPEGYTKFLIGDGPYLPTLKEKYFGGNIHFLGKKKGKELSECYANADLFVFPSKTDTFGLTQLESISSGTPVLAYKGTVSDEIIKNGISGYLVDELTIDKIQSALKLSREIVEEDSKNWSWENCTQIFKNSLVKK